MNLRTHYDVAILGAGLSGLTLARQLNLACDKRVLVVERAKEVPPAQQKRAETTSAVMGYYLGKVLELETHLAEEHLPAHADRFFWKSADGPGENFEELCQALRLEAPLVPRYHLDRNRLEAELIKLARESGKTDFALDVKSLAVTLEDSGDHALKFQTEGTSHECRAGWVVDASGVSGLLKAQLGLDVPTALRHGASHYWVEGQIDVGNLTQRSPKDKRLAPEKRLTGHVPPRLSLNHFLGEGFWFWALPQRGKTSFGLVYDTARLAPEIVSTPQRLQSWLWKQFPLFTREKGRAVRDWAFSRALSRNVQQAFGKRWAITGRAGRFSDPLYGHGLDLVALHNTLIGHAVAKLTPEDLESHQFLYDLLLRTLFESGLPSFETSYDCLGDMECFVLKHTWEQAFSHTFLAFPFVGELFAHQPFILPYLERLSALTAVSRRLHELFGRFYQWKKREGRALTRAMTYDLSSLSPLVEAERLLLQVGVGVPEALRLMDAQMERLRELARFLVAHVTARVAGDSTLIHHKDFVESLPLEQIAFDPKAIADRVRMLPAARESYPWRLDAGALKSFWPEAPKAALKAV
jgi:flavin-dependent dehydrogenase